METLLNSKQLAKRLGISLRTLDTLNKQAQLPTCLRIGNLRRWRSEDVENWINSKIEEKLSQSPISKLES